MQDERRDYRLAALDMDGTLLNSDHQTSAYTRRALRRAADAGRIVALSTGRCLSELWTHFAANPDIRYAICENGACLYDTRLKRAVYQITLPGDAADRVMEEAKGYDVCRQLFLGNQSCICLAPGTNLGRYHIADYESVFQVGSVFVEDIEALRRSHPAPPEKINLYFTCEADKRDFLPRIEKLGLQVSASIGIGVEISPPEATKAEGLRRLCGHLAIDIADAMAVGDGGNDMDIMGAAGLAVAMGNAIDEVRALADAVTDDCDHDGAARAILRYMGLEEI